MVRLVSGIIFILFPLWLKASPGEEIIFRRIVYLYDLKKEIGQAVWPDFNDAANNIPLIYYTDTSSYISNPTPKFLRKVHAHLVFSEKDITIYKTEERLDDMPFQMFVYFDIEDTSSFYYQTPFMRCSGVEETARRTQTPPDTRAWSALVIHEFFHGFQYQHRPLTDFTIRSKIYYQATGDTLEAIYDQFPWFKEAVDAENQYVLQWLKKPGNDTAGMGTLVKMMRDRRTRTREELGINITGYEKGLEMVEGTSRYLEAWVIANPVSGHMIKGLEGLDPYFSSSDGKSLQNLYEMRKDLSHTDVSDRYYYAQGYVLCLLLDKLKKDYKTNIFNTGDFSLEQFLLQQ